VLPKVTRVERLGGFRLRVRFNDGSEGVHDFAAIVGELGSALECFSNSVRRLGRTASTSRAEHGLERPDRRMFEREVGVKDDCVAATR
jgi:hypothetical protein